MLLLAASPTSRSELRKCIRSPATHAHGHEFPALRAPLPSDSNLALQLRSGAMRKLGVPRACPTFLAKLPPTNGKATHNTLKKPLLGDLCLAVILYLAPAVQHVLLSRRLRRSASASQPGSKDFAAQPLQSCVSRGTTKACANIQDSCILPGRRRW